MTDEIATRYREFEIPGTAQVRVAAAQSSNGLTQHYAAAVYLFFDKLP
jgi:hypothetical protein